MPKFEKINDTEMKVTREVANIINVPNLVKGRNNLIEQIKTLQEQLKEVSKAIEEAIKLGIDVSVKKDEPKSNPCESCKNRK